MKVLDQKLQKVVRSSADSCATWQRVGAELAAQLGIRTDAPAFVDALSAVGELCGGAAGNTPEARRGLRSDLERQVRRGDDVS